VLIADTERTRGNLKSGAIIRMGKPVLTAKKQRPLTGSFSLTTFRFAMYGFWGSILLIAMLSNGFNSFWHNRASRSISDIEASQSSTRPAKSSQAGRVSHWVKTNLIIPSLFGTKHRQLYYGFTVPTRMEAIIVGVFWPLSLILCAVDIRTFEGNL